MTALGIFRMEPGRQKYLGIYENIPVSATRPLAADNRTLTRDRQQKKADTAVSAVSAPCERVPSEGGGVQVGGGPLAPCFLVSMFPCFPVSLFREMSVIASL